MVDTFFLIVGEDLPIGRQAPTIRKKLVAQRPFQETLLGKTNPPRRRQ